MDQRRPRLGDILDDYCPRERRITNHAVVAMVVDDVKQTRCTTCDAEHEYKHAKVPAARRRKAETAAAHLVDAASKLPAETPDAQEDTPEIEVPIMTDASESDSEEESVRGTPVSGVPAEHLNLAAAPEASVEAAASESSVDEGPAESDNWPVHRPLIRAQLPRPEGHVPERKAPDFTFRPGGGRFDSNRDPNRNGQRPRGHRPGRHAGGGQPSGPGQGSSRFGGQRGPGGQGGGGGPFGQRQGNRSGQGGGGGRPGPGQGQGQGQGRGPRPGGGRKRGR
jgi:hypothetical protein